MKHGLFTWGETAKESYDRHIHFIQKAENFIREKAEAKIKETRTALLTDSYIPLEAEEGRNVPPPYDIIAPV